MINSREETRRNTMKKNIWTLPLCLLLLLSVFPAPRLYSEDQGWISNSLTVNINSHTRFVFFNDFRYHDVPFTDFYLSNWQAGFLLNILKNVHVGVAYKRQETQELQYTLKENRFIAEVGWRKALSRSLDLRCRFNAEIRKFAAYMAPRHLRFRMRFLLHYKLSILKLKTIPFIGVEPFFDTETNEISQNRWYAGVLFPICKKIRLEIGYTRRDWKNREVLHILNTGLHIEL